MTVRTCVIGAMALLLAGCATNTREVKTVESEAAPDQDITIGFGATRRAEWGMFAVLQNDSNGWSVAKLIDSRTIGVGRSFREREGQEVLFISSDMKFAEPYYEDRSQIQQETVICNLIGAGNPSYNPCSSRFMTVNAFMSAAKTAWSILTNLGMNSGTHKALDHEEVALAIAEANLVETVGKRVAALEYMEYRAAFDNAQTALDYSYFIERYSRHDPDRLISQAIDRRNILLYQEELASQGIDPVTLEQRAAEASESELEQFRASLDVGIDTNCGPVLAAEGGWLRIQKDVEGHGDVHWIEQDKIFPPGFDCRFENGQYVTP